MSQPRAPGWVMPDQKSDATGHQHQHPGYPSYPHQPQQQAYPYPQQQITYQQPPAYQHQPFPAPIQQQPGFGGQGYAPSVQWISNPDFHAYLRNATSFHVKQKVELLEALVGWETPNRYTVKDNFGNKVFYVGEESGCLGRQCCGKYRPFDLKVKDGRGTDVLAISRPIDCSCCCGLILPDSVTVSTLSGQKLGSVVEEFNLIYPTFNLLNAADATVLKIQGPTCPIAFGCGPVVFRVTTLDGVSVGTISKEWSGLVRELFTDADYFSMSFPVDLDPAMKAVCLAALFLIDFEYFEASGGNATNQGGRRIFA